MTRTRVRAFAMLGVGSGLALAALAFAAQAAAANPTPEAKPAAIPAAAMNEAKEIFNSRCFTCHGQSGKGDGPAAAAMQPKPRDLTDPAWQKSVTDQHIEKIVLEGGAAVGKSPLMPPNPDLSSKPDVVKALRAMVRDFGGAAK